jgi:hypothetical protein
MKKNTLYIAFCAVLFLSHEAFPESSSEKSEPEHPRSIATAIGIQSNSGDVMAYGGAGIYFYPAQLLSIRAHYYKRISDKSIFEEKSPARYYQYKEDRSGLDLVIDGAILPENVPFPVPAGIFYAGGIGHTSAKYRGTKAEAKSKTTPVGKVGVQIGRIFILRFGYQYMKIPFTPSNHLILELGFSY